jgi:hypothetical protein
MKSDRSPRQEGWKVIPFIPRFDCVSPACFPVIEMAGFRSAPSSEPGIEMAGFLRRRYPAHPFRD